MTENRKKFHSRPSGKPSYKAGRTGGSKSYSGKPAKALPAGPAPNLWGLHAVTEAWRNPARTIKALYITEAMLKTFENELQDAQNRGLSRPQAVVMDRKDLDRMLPAGTVHQGIVCDAEPLEEIFVQDLISRAAPKERAVIVILDQVTDPHNIGAILRSACVFGADGLVMQRRHSPEPGGIMAKTASGALEHVPIAYETNLSRAIEALQAAGFTAIALDERGPDSLSEITAPAKTVVVLGAEGPGLRPKVREQCDRLVRLPISGPIGSLNVSNAAAVALYGLLHK